MSLLLTELKDEDKVNKRANETIRDLREEKAKESSYLIYHQKAFNKAESKVVEYLLTDETMYTSIEKAEGLYQTRLEEKRRKLDALTLTANKLKAEETSLSSRISEETVTNVVQGTDAIEEKYLSKINPLYPEIEALSHSLQVYRNQKEELLQENVRLKQQMNDEYKQSLIRNDQMHKFSIINNSIKSESAMKDKLYNTMSSFSTKAQRMYKEKEEKKKHQYAIKELELAQFKEDAIELEKQLNRIIQKRQAKEKLFPEEDYKNCKIYLDNALIRKENNLNLIKLEGIKKSIHVKDLSTAISYFKEQSIKYESSYNQYNKLMKELAELHGQLSYECSELQRTKERMEAKETKPSLVVDDPLVVQLQKEGNEMKEEIALVTAKCDSMELFIKSIFAFINSYHEKTISIMKSIVINSGKLTVFSLGSIDDIIKTYFDNKEIIGDVQRFSSFKRFEQKDFPALLQCILKYLRNWHVIYFNLIVEMALHYCSLHSPAVMKGSSFFEFILNDFIDQDFEVETKQKRIKTYNDKLADKKKIMSGIIHSEKQLNQMHFDISKSSQTVSIEELFKRFLIHFDRQMREKEALCHEAESKASDKGKGRNPKKKDIISERESMDILVSKLRNKFFIHLSGYVNELVEKYQKPKLDYTGIHLTNSVRPTRTLQKKNTVIQGIMDLLWKNAASRDKKSNEDELEDSYHEDNDKKAITNKKGSISHYYESLYANPNANANRATLFNRINDLHKLNFEMFHNRSNRRVYDEISSVCATTMNSKSFFKLMEQSKPKNRLKTKKTTIRNHKTETADTNNRTTVTNDQSHTQRAAIKKQTNRIEIQ